MSLLEVSIDCDFVEEVIRADAMLSDDERSVRDIADFVLGCTFSIVSIEERRLICFLGGFLGLPGHLLDSREGDRIFCVYKPIVAKLDGNPRIVTCD